VNASLNYRLPRRDQLEMDLPIRQQGMSRPLLN